MKLSDIKISTKLTLGFLSILTLVSGMSLINYYQANKLWRYTEDLYNHPLHVARATRDLKSEILLIQDAVNEIVYSSTDIQEIHAKQIIEQNEQKVNEALVIIKERYLGPKENIDSVEKAFNIWKVSYYETIHLYESGSIEIARARTMNNHIERQKINEVIERVDVIINFAKNKGNQFYQSAKIDRDKISGLSISLVFIVLILTFGISLYLIFSIRKPLSLMTQATQKYSEGDYQIRSPYKSKNEIGQLSAALNILAERVQNTIVAKQITEKIVNSIAKGNELNSFTNRLLNSLINETGAQIATIYFYNNENNLYDPINSIGVNVNNLSSINALTSEGDFSLAMNQKDIIYLKNIHNFNYSIQTVLGDIKPKEIITIPIIELDKVVALISIASLNEFSQLIIDAIKNVYPILNERIIGVIAYQKVIEVSSKLNMQNRELESQSKELTVQTEELKEYAMELEVQKQKLNESNQLKSSFLSNMSHELRTPLNSVIALSGVLLRKIKDTNKEEEKKYLGIIEKNGKHLLELINDILDISRIESGKEEFAFNSFSLKKLVEEIVESQETVIKDKKLDLLINIPDNDNLITDKSKFHHIMQNLINNAIKFTENGFVKISAFEDNDKLLISVEDSGIGISESSLPYIFDEFRQGDEKLSKKYGGTGLGLAIVKKYVTMLEGTINLKSKIGKGTVFSIQLPKVISSFKGEISVSNDEFMGSIIEKNINTEHHSDKKTILLIEDSEPAIIQMKDILENAGYDLEYALNGKQALEILSKNKYDAIILDLMMPEIDGFEVLAKLRNSDPPNLTPVLVLSAKHITKEEFKFLKGNHIYQLIQKGDINKPELLSYVYNMTHNAKIIYKNDFIQKDKSNASKILLIDDNIDTCISINAILENNYNFIFATDGKEGLKIADKHKPELILLDISLPQNDGYEIFQLLKMNPNLNDTRIIAFTAKAMKGDKEKLLQFGFDDYIAKPIDTNNFEQQIKKWINGYV